MPMYFSKSKIEVLIKEEIRRLNEVIEDEEDELVTRAKSIIKELTVFGSALRQALSILKPPEIDFEVIDYRDKNKMDAWEVISDQFLEAGVDVPHRYSNMPNVNVAINFVWDMKDLMDRIVNKCNIVKNLLTKFDPLNDDGVLESEIRNTNPKILLSDANVIRAQAIIEADKRNQQSLAPWQQNK